MSNLASDKNFNIKEFNNTFFLMTITLVIFSASIEVDFSSFIKLLILSVLSIFLWINNPKSKFNPYIIVANFLLLGLFGYEFYLSLVNYKG